MGTSREQKAQSRKAIVHAAARLFRESGIGGVSVAEIMEAAGMTHGGFPRHFASKTELVSEALAFAVDEGTAKPRADFRAFAQDYLSMDHRNNPGGGCAYAALGTEVSRASEEARAVMTSKIGSQIEAFATTGSSESTDQSAAIGRWAALVGAMVLARATNSDKLARTILAATEKFVTTPAR